MNDTTQEQLSALLDGELPRDETRFLLRRLDNDPELARRWSRYQVASAVLRNQFVSSVPNDAFVAGVMQRLDVADVALPRQSIGGRLLRYAGGGAIAAAVAVFALVATRPAGTDVAAPVAGGALVSAQQATAAAAPAAPVGELHQPITIDQVALPGFIDYAQPASYYESIVPNYATASRNPAGQLVNGNAAEGFVPYVLVVGARPASAQPAPRSEPAPAQH